MANIPDSSKLSYSTKKNGENNYILKLFNKNAQSEFNKSNMYFNSLSPNIQNLNELHNNLISLQQLNRVHFFFGDKSLDKLDLTRTDTIEHVSQRFSNESSLFMRKSTSSH